MKSFFLFLAMICVLGLSGQMYRLDSILSNGLSNISDPSSELTFKKTFYQYQGFNLEKKENYDILNENAVLIDYTKYLESVGNYANCYEYKHKVKAFLNEQVCVYDSTINGDVFKVTKTFNTSDKLKELSLRYQESEGENITYDSLVGINITTGAAYSTFVQKLKYNNLGDRTEYIINGMTMNAHDIVYNTNGTKNTEIVLFFDNNGQVVFEDSISYTYEGDKIVEKNINNYKSTLIGPMYTYTYEKDLLKNKQILNFDSNTGTFYVTCNDDYYYSLVTSTDETNLQKDFDFYPNPVSDAITISPNTEAVELYHVNGRRLARFETAQHTIDVSSLESGVYFIKPIFKNGVGAVKKLIKL